MLFRFTGKYTNGATGVSILNHRFEGREPTDVRGETAVRLSHHPEYEIVEEAKAEPVVEDRPTLHIAPPKNKGGRPRKVVSQ